MKNLVYEDSVFKITEKQFKKLNEIRDSMKTVVGYYGSHETNEQKLRDYLQKQNFKKIGKIDFEYRN